MTATGRVGSSANATAAACTASSPPAALCSAAAAAAAAELGMGGGMLLFLNCGLQQTSSCELSVATRATAADSRPRFSSRFFSFEMASVDVAARSASRCSFSSSARTQQAPLSNLRHARMAGGVEIEVPGVATVGRPWLPYREDEEQGGVERTQEALPLEERLGRLREESGHDRGRCREQRGGGLSMPG
jgi:hypothetical protein